MECFNLRVPACELGEGPVWDPERQCLWWVDINQGAVHQYHITSEIHREIKTGSLCSAVLLCDSGKLIVTLKDGFAYMDAATGSTACLAKIEEDLPENRFNDAKCDPAGRVWAGTMNYCSGQPGAGNLYALEAEHTVVKKLTDITCSNGMAWSPDHQLFYYIDSPTREVTAFSYDKATGTISNKRTIIQIPETQGMPDGMTIDDEGMLWVAVWGGSSVIRYDPFSGKCLSKIQLPVVNVTSCTFGGENLEDLYITTAMTGQSDEALKEQPLAGQVFVCKNTGCKGLPPHKFRD